MSRRELREELMHLRNTMSVDELVHLGTKIAEQVFHTEWYRKAKVVHCFSGTVSKGEIPTDIILRDVLAGKQLVMPKMSAISGYMDHYSITDTVQLKANKWGILEPDPDICTPMPIEEIDLILVPGLAGDRRGNRIGYGKGYYDRFLGNSKARTMLLIPERFLLDDIPTEHHDIAVHAIATESGVVIC